MRFFREHGFGIMGQRIDEVEISTAFFQALENLGSRYWGQALEMPPKPLSMATILIDHVADLPNRSNFKENELLDALTLVAGARIVLDFCETALLEKNRRRGISFARIATSLGLRSRQAAEQRLLKLGSGDSRAADKKQAEQRRVRLNAKTPRTVAIHEWWSSAARMSALNPSEWPSPKRSSEENVRDD
ncbi:hypothetical protein ACI2LC_46545 [Nonomuraea wenchangensis]|uniref:hypothetical protein n=1 Tax=Nonomuraea wenchangensis TaxID=568860 RepID=UPI00384B966F